ncbi:hydrogenase maturation protease [Microbispora cellulosiformans]|uniref:Hydrogenase maturation protease n=1 Tax=Microbispora cellulosiformans TaxID=2614688 RepID=A0A5J5K376_9ACTN|nr:hydrogenase maturation protease [Microbispora cellulosiformans]KAA9378444.1 hydrogenase maturation protease [Microbispora cellulosiformans]
MSTGDTVVVGLGSDLRGDDAAGLAVARLLGDAPPPGVAVEACGDAAALVEAWSGAALAIVVDAVRTGAAPGTVHHRLPDLPASLPAAGWHGGTHSLGLVDAVDLGRALGRLPGELVVVGIEGGDFTPGAPMTPPVLAAVRRTARELRERLSRERRAGRRR